MWSSRSSLPVSVSSSCRGEVGAPTTAGPWESMGDIMTPGFHSYCRALPYTGEEELLNHVTGLVLIKQRKTLNKSIQIFFNNRVSNVGVWQSPPRWAIVFWQGDCLPPPEHADQRSQPLAASTDGMLVFQHGCSIKASRWTSFSLLNTRAECRTVSIEPAAIQAHVYQPLDKSKFNQFSRDWTNFDPCMAFSVQSLDQLLSHGEAGKL